jgi:alkylation response protein AidB-like acyl-CoA dehydrogenase
MDFQKTEEQELLLQSLKEFIEQNFPDDYFRTCDREHAYPNEFIKGLTDAGLGLLGLPEEWGGTPVDYPTLVMFCEEVARCTATSYLTSYLIYVDDVLAFGTEEQKKVTMDLVSQGKPSLCLGISEPQAGSDNSAMTSTATKRGDKYYINGHKTFITNAPFAPYMLLFTRDLENPKPHSAMTMWFMPMDKKGVKIETLDKIGWNMRPSSEVYLEDVELEEKDIIGEPNKGFFQLMKNFEIERLIMCAGSVGCAQAAFDDAITYARQRVQFGKPIGSYQLIQEKLVNMATKITLMRNFVYQCAWEKEHGMDVRISSALCKRYCSRSGFEVVDDAMQILGGIGYTNDTRISRMWRDLRVSSIGGGTDEIMVYIAGRALMKDYKVR